MAKANTKDQGHVMVGNRLAAELADDIGDLKAKAAKLYARHILPLEQEQAELRDSLLDAGVVRAVGARHKVSISESISWRLDKDGLAAEVGQAMIDKHSHPGAPSVRTTVTATKPAEAATRSALTSTTVKAA